MTEAYKSYIQSLEEKTEARGVSCNSVRRIAKAMQMIKDGDKVDWNEIYNTKNKNYDNTHQEISNCV